MKQRITVEQLNELSEEQKARLWELWQPSEGDTVLVNRGILKNYVITFSEDCLSNFPQKPIGYVPLLNIGQMIEIIKDKLSSIHFHGGNVIVSFYHASVEKQFIKDNLCDALCEAVKAIL